MMGGAATGSPVGMGAGMGIAGIFLLIGAACAHGPAGILLRLPGRRAITSTAPNPYGAAGGTSAG